MTNVETAPVPVQVVNHPEPKRYEVRAAYRTVVLTAANPFLSLVGYDPLRVCLRFSGGPNAFVISGSVSQASDPANLVAVPVNPNGRLIPAGSASGEFTTDGQNEVWVSAGTYPTLIGYEIIRKVSE